MYEKTRRVRCICTDLQCSISQFIICSAVVHTVDHFVDFSYFPNAGRGRTLGGAPIGCGGDTHTPLKPPRTLILKAHLLEMFVSIGFIAAGSAVWISMNGSNSPVTLLTGAALLVAGVIVFGSTMKTILRY
jgi:hypothetical protein